MRRTEDWIRQARKDLSHARKSIDMGDYEWSCFSAQQSAEKAVKAVYESLGSRIYGHSVSTLLQQLPRLHGPGTSLINLAKLLDRHYIPSRYANSHPQGAPMDYYTRDDALQAVEIAAKIHRYCESRIRSSKAKTRKSAEKISRTRKH